MFAKPLCGQVDWDEPRGRLMCESRLPPLPALAVPGAGHQVAVSEVPRKGLGSQHGVFRARTLAHSAQPGAYVYSRMEPISESHLNQLLNLYSSLLIKSDGSHPESRPCLVKRVKFHMGRPWPSQARVRFESKSLVGCH